MSQKLRTWNWKRSTVEEIAPQIVAIANRRPRGICVYVDRDWLHAEEALEVARLDSVGFLVAPQSSVAMVADSLRELQAAERAPR